MRFTNTLAATLAIGCLPIASGHHSNAEWDENAKHELEGVVVNVVWRNPHVHWSMTVRNEQGEEELWNLAGSSLNHLDRQGVPRDTFEAGDVIRVWGAPSSRRPRSLNADSVLLGDGREIMVRRSEPHWPLARQVGEPSGESGYANAAVENARPNGLFNVWRSVRGVGSTSRDRGTVVLTPEAETVLATWNDLDNWVVRCEPRGMPSTMFNSYPRQFVEEDGNIVLRIEEHDNTRIIHMSDEIDAASQPATRLGFSVGHWENERTLVVHTSRISFPWFSTSGIPQSEDVSMVERFTLSEDELQLDYEITTTDPATFVVPQTSTALWVAVDGVEIQPFDMNCDDNPWVRTE